MKGRIPLARPSFSLEDAQVLHEVLASGQLVQAGRVAAFEAALSAALDGTRVVAVSSGTAALHLCLLALEAPPGAEVIMPAFTFPCVANVAHLAGLTPVFVDIDLDHLGPDAACVNAALTERTAAVVWVHQFGNVPRDASGLEAIQARGIPLIEDAACSLGTRLGGRASGTIGTLGCTSFHPRKVLTTGEGGAIFTRDERLEATLRCLRNHGQAADAPGFLRFERIGLNYRMGELNAALGNRQLTNLPYLLERRRRLGRRYVEQLAAVHGVLVPAAFREGRANFQSFVVLLDQCLDRQHVIDGLQARGVESTLGGYSIPHQPAWASRFGAPGDRFPAASHAFTHSLALPMHPGLDEADVDAVVSALQEVIE